MTSLLKRKCFECDQTFPYGTQVCPHDGNLLATTLARSGVGLKLCDRFELLEEVGRGGMGAIYTARDHACDEPQHEIVAIKLLVGDASKDETMRNRFMVEARAASSLSHPNIVKVIEFSVSSEGLPFLVMEYLKGQSLDQLIRSESKLNTELALRYAVQICDALAHAHRRDIIHRDIKPSNIMIVDDDGLSKAVLVDFGIAKIFTQPGKTSMRLTQTGEIFGSPLYMSPEQCMGQKLDHRSDIYAVGCLLFECLTGQCPFEGDNFLEVVFNHINMTPSRFSNPTAADLMIEPIVHRALEKAPDRRYQSMLDMRLELERCLVKISSGVIDDTEGERELDDDFAYWIRRAESGDVNAQFDLALFYRYGHFVESDDEIAFEWCLKAARLGLASAQSFVADMYRFSWGVDEDLHQAHHWYNLAAEQNAPDAMACLGAMYENGQGCDVDLDLSLSWYRKAAELESLSAQMQLGRRYKFGVGVKLDLVESTSWFRRAAEQGDADGQLQLAFAYRWGDGVQRDDEEAFFWFRSSAEQGLAEAQHWLAISYENGEGVEKDGGEATRWMKESATNGHAQAHTWLGFNHAFGYNGLPRDSKLAVNYYRQGAELGDTDANYYLGDHYQRGDGVPLNYQTAVHWYKSAAAAGHTDAQIALGLCYRDGLGVTEASESNFLYWLNKAADKGNSEAQFQLGKHFQSKGDALEAKRWLRLAADQDHKKAKKALDNYGKR
ncbi:MAG: protein kinase [Candidatus Obscuribacterales bacterium]|nr:protein kinase [Candidatus Obscuribacterales bacterium]